MERKRKPFRMKVAGAEVGAPQDGYQPITLATSRGTILYRSYPAPGARRGAIWVSGIGDGFDTPARGLYPRLCQELMGRGISSLWVRFRHPTMLEESILDVLAGIDYLKSEGVDTLALIGWSFGGAVVIQAAAISEAVRAVVTIATQSYGVEPIAQLAPRCPVLLLHGADDRVLPLSCSEYAYDLAQEPRRLIRYEGAGHDLDEVAEEVHQVVGDWIVEQLSAQPD